MKKIFPIVCVLGILVMVLVACSSSSGGSDTADEDCCAKVPEVVPYTPDDIAASNATAQWSSVELFAEELPDILDGISLEFQDTLELFSDDPDESSSDFVRFINEMNQAFKNFPVNKTLNKSFSGENFYLGDYHHYIKKLNCAIKADVVTTDSANLDIDDGDNFKSGTGSANFSTEIIFNDINSYYLKSVMVRINFGTCISTDSRVEEDYRIPNNLKLCYATSGSIAISYNNGTEGGKIIINFTMSKPSTTIEDPDASDENETLVKELSPKVFLASATLYKDDGTKVYWKSFTSFEDLLDKISW